MVISSIQRKLVLLGFIIVPFISIGELFALFSGAILSQSSNTTGVFKFSKDIIFILLILLGTMDYLFSNTLNKKVIIYIFLTVLIVLPPILLSIGSDLLFLASGLRWLIPVLLPVFLYKVVTKDLLKTLSTFIFYLLMIHFLMQIFQMFFASSWYGTSAFGLNLRNPGLFLIPNTGAFFTIACLYFSVFIAEYSQKKKIFVLIIAAFSVFLTLSGTGLVVFMFLLLLNFSNIRQLKWFVLMIPFAILFVLFFVDFLSARDENYLEKSGGTRLSIFVENFIDGQVISGEFGLGTNTAVLLGKGEIMDSTFVSLVVNLGFMGFFLVVGILMFFIIFSMVSGNKPFFVFLSVFTLFSFTNIVFEVYPVNLIMAVLLVYFMKQGKESNKSKALA
jgi:hypothetical protein